MFRRHIELALKTKKPMVLHIRGPKALAVAKEVLESMVPKDWPIHMHAFTNSWKTCQYWAENWTNMKFGFVVDCFDSETIRNLPLNKILLETDAPYFISKDDREENIGSSMPGNVKFVANQIGMHF